MPTIALGIHGISDSQLHGQPEFIDVLPGLAKVLEGAVVVAHNAQFDIGFLRAECHRAGVDAPELGPVVCTLDLARSLYGFSKCSLEALARRTQTPQGAAHRALADTVTTMGVYKSMLLGLGGAEESAPTVGELLERADLLRKGGVGRQDLSDQICAAVDSDSPLTIDYTNRYGDGPLTTRRRVSVREARLPYFDAWCHLEREVCTFHIRRVQRIL
jgi:DNA polymerase III epsilon subunit-like protein